jgi:hypothetical protein
MQPLPISSPAMKPPAPALLLQVACVLSALQLGAPADEPSPPPGAEPVPEADDDSLNGTD